LCGPRDAARGRSIEHLGSAHSDDELAALKVVAAERVAAGQVELDLGLDAGTAVGPLEVVGSKAGHLWDALSRVYDSLGFDEATGGDEVFRALVLARIIEPTSKLDSLRVLEEAGVESVSYRTLTRRLPRYGKPLWRKDIAAACAAHAALGPASPVLYDVSTLYFETDQGDGFREPGFSKERRLEPQITIGLLTDATGFPLAVEAFEGNKAETATMVPTMPGIRLTNVGPGALSPPLASRVKRPIPEPGLTGQATRKDVAGSFALGASTVLRSSPLFPLALLAATTPHPLRLCISAGDRQYGRTRWRLVRWRRQSGVVQPH
jgi:hypothetical protein